MIIRVSMPADHIEVPCLPLHPPRSLPSWRGPLHQHDTGRVHTAVVVDVVGGLKGRSASPPTGEATDNSTPGLPSSARSSASVSRAPVPTEPGSPLGCADTTARSSKPTGRTAGCGVSVASSTRSTRRTDVSSWRTGNLGEIDHGPVGASVMTRFSYSRRALRCVGIAAALPSGWQRSRSWRCTAGMALTRRV